MGVVLDTMLVAWHLGSVCWGGGGRLGVGKNMLGVAVMEYGRYEVDKDDTMWLRHVVMHSASVDSNIGVTNILEFPRYVYMPTCGHTYTPLMGPHPEIYPPHGDYPPY